MAIMDMEKLPTNRIPIIAAVTYLIAAVRLPASEAEQICCALDAMKGPGSIEGNTQLRGGKTT